MLFGSFTIETYDIIIGVRAGPIGMIRVSSRSMAHGIIDRATLFYGTPYTDVVGGVQNVGGLDYDGIQVFAAMPFDEFERHYHVLQTESPVVLHYGYERSDSPNKRLVELFFKTGAERPGEGLQDLDAMLASMSAAMGRASAGP